MEWWWLIVAAVASSFCTLLLVALWIQLVVRPMVIHEVQSVIREEAREASQVIAKEVEAAVKTGLLEGVKVLPSREVLQNATRTLAKTGAEIVEDRLSGLFRSRSE